MKNIVGVKIPFTKNNSVTIVPDDLNNIIIITGIIKPVQFALDFCDGTTLQQSAHLEILSI